MSNIFMLKINVLTQEHCWVNNHPDVWSKAELSFFPVISVKTFGQMNITRVVRQLSGNSGQEYEKFSEQTSN